MKFICRLHTYSGGYCLAAHWGPGHSAIWWLVVNIPALVLHLLNLASLETFVWYVISWRIVLFYPLITTVFTISWLISISWFTWNDVVETTLKHPCSIYYSNSLKLSTSEAFLIHQPKWLLLFFPSVYPLANTISSISWLISINLFIWNDVEEITLNHPYSICYIESLRLWAS